MPILVSGAESDAQAAELRGAVVSFELEVRAAHLTTVSASHRRCHYRGISGEFEQA